jgi:hypothetical protein
VADYDFMGGHAFLHQEGLLFLAHGTLVSVGGDRGTGFHGRQGGGSQHVVFVVGDLALPGGHLDDARLDSGVADALAEFVDEEFRHGFNPTPESAGKVPVGKSAFVLLIESGGADDVKAGTGRYFGCQFNIAPQVVGAGVEH